MSVSDINAASGVPEQLDHPVQKEIGKEAFLMLLVAQMEHQDPLDPTDNTEFVAQLAQFSSLEAMQNLQSDMGDVSLNMNALRHQSSSDLVGRVVTVEGDKFNFSGTEVPLAYDLGGSASEVKVKIVDQSGRVVRTITGEPGPAGEYSMFWNGLDQNGVQAAEGSYNLEVSAKDDSGEEVDVTTFVSDMVTSVLYEDGKSMLSVGSMLVSVDKVKGIY